MGEEGDRGGREASSLVRAAGVRASSTKRHAIVPRRRSASVILDTWKLGSRGFGT